MQHLTMMNPGDSATYVIEKMRSASHRQERNNEDYMENTAASMLKFENIKIRINSEENFVEDMIRNNKVEKMKQFPIINQNEGS